MNKETRSVVLMNSCVVKIDKVEKESNAYCIAPDGEIKEGFKFPINRNGYIEFRNKTTIETRIAFKASGSAYEEFKALKDPGHDDITVTLLVELSWITKLMKKNDNVDSVIP